jgi:hypothetical protein
MFRLMLALPLLGALLLPIATFGAPGVSDQDTGVVVLKNGVEVDPSG